jgi:toxin ParE1/3/4
VSSNFSNPAKADVIDIALYIARDNAARGLSFTSEIEVKCSDLENTPGIGMPRPALGKNIRCTPHGNYLIFYRRHQGSTRIERIIHRSRDISEDSFN